MQNQSTDTTLVNGTGSLGTVKAASAIALLAGIWLFVSPWVYGAYTHSTAWNSWIVGGFIVLFALVRLGRPRYSAVLSWCNMVLGIWTFCSPWIYGYATTNMGRFINSLCVGFIVFVFSIVSARLSASRSGSLSQHV
jgi:hypothetical protein